MSNNTNIQIMHEIAKLYRIQYLMIFHNSNIINNFSQKQHKMQNVYHGDATNVIHLLNLVLDMSTS